MPRFLVVLTRGVLEILRLGEPRAVTLPDGTRGETRTLTPIDPSSPDATKRPTLAPGASAPHLPEQ